MRKGFSLIETLVAVSILSLMLTGAVALMQQTLQISSKLKSDTTAVFLAQEGLELIRWQRDTNRMNGDSWMEDIHPGDPCGNANGCIADLDISDGELELDSCGGGGCPLLRFDPVTKIYNYTVGGNSVYRRTIRTFNVPGPQPEVRVRVTVNWTTKFGARSYVVEENLLDWQ